jgi:hypothetical protein
LELSMIVPAVRECWCSHWVQIYRFLELSQYRCVAAFFTHKAIGPLLLEQILVTGIRI